MYAIIRISGLIKLIEGTVTISRTSNQAAAMLIQTLPAVLTETINFSHILPITLVM